MKLAPELVTIKDYLRYALTEFNQADLYYGHGTDNAWDEALAIILSTLHLPYSLDPSLLDAKLTAEEKSTLTSLIMKRVKDKIPAAYLTNTAWFAGLKFYVDERVLIPRSPLAELIEQHFEPWVSEDNVNSILDLCCGSACIAIACSLAFPDAQVDAADISSDALAVAEINKRKHQPENTLNLIQSDLFENLQGKRYDIIVSNPPYVSKEEMDSLPDEYRHEPSLGLASGELGLDCTNKILSQAANHLNDKGILIVEVGNSEYHLEQLYPDLPCTWLEFERGGGGVFLMYKEDLESWLEQSALS